MNPLERALAVVSWGRQRLHHYRTARRWAEFRSRGLKIGKDVWLPPSTFIDLEYCFLISIGDHCGFGEQCMILAHDAQMDEFLDAGRIGAVVIHESCHIGARTVILPGTEMGPRTIVGSNSVVSRSLPPDTVCAGSPARVICSLEEYLQKHRDRLASLPTFPYQTEPPLAEARAQMLAAVRGQGGYVVGGRSKELAGKGGTPRT